MARLGRIWWLVLAAVPGLVVNVVSCSDDPAPATDAADASPDGKQRSAPDSSDDPDAAEAAAKVPPPVLPGCIGTSIPLVVPNNGERGYVIVDMTSLDQDAAVVDAGGDAGKVLGDFLLDFGANGSTVDFKGFDMTGPPVPSSCLGDASIPGALCSFDHFDFFGPWGSVTLVTADYGFLVSSIRQAGIIGTDFLSVYPFTIEYTNLKVSRSQVATFCTDAQLLGAGLGPLPAGGFYTNKFNTLRPLSNVLNDPDAAATAGFTVPNVPTVPITVAGASALAQLDTGYDDRIDTHSININEALLKQLQAQTPSKITRKTGKDLFLTTCVPGLSQAGRAYLLEPGTEVNFVGEGSTIVRHDTGTYLFVKENLPAAQACGGIETWTVPAAQMGASFLKDAQAVVFDPVSSRVWIPKN